MIRLATSAALLAGLCPALASPTPAQEQDAAARRARVENGLFGQVRIEGGTWRVEERMRHHRLAGMSVAVIRDFELDWAAGYGVRDARTKEAVTTRTLFQAASISKPVSALAAMTLVQDGKLPLDEDIRDHLGPWRLRANDVALENDLTLAQLLSHTGGTTVHGFAGYARYEPLPTLEQVLDGKPPANSAAVFMDIPSGQRFRYSGGGSTIVQKAMIEASGQDFATLLRERVLDPLGMRDSTFEQPLPVATWTDFASAHAASGTRVAGGFHTYPEQFAAGLWTTPSDLARVLVEMQLAWRGDPDRIVDEELARRMLTPVHGEYGLGFGVETWPGGEVYFGHNGSNEGFKCFAQAHREGGFGVVVMTNGDSGPRAAEELINAVKYVYGWPGYSPTTAESIFADPDAVFSCAGRYALEEGGPLLVRSVGDRLLARICPEPPFELVPVGDGEYVDSATGGTVRFAEPEAGKHGRVEIDGPGGERTGRRLAASDDRGAVELFSTGDVDGGLAALRAIHATDADDGRVSEDRVTELAVALGGAGDLEAATAVASFAVELYPTSPGSWDTLAKSLELLERWDDAASAYSKVLETLPSDSTVQGYRRSYLKQRATTWLAEREARR